MAHIGMKYPVAAPWKEGNNYDAGYVVGKAISFTGTPNKNDTTLYADDGASETDLSVRDWGTSLSTDDLSLKVQADLLGHTYKEAAGTGDAATPEEIEIGTDDVAPYVGMGFYKRRRKNNITSFTAIWLYKVQNSEPTENAETKGESTNFQTPTIEGKAFPVEIKDEDGNVKMSIGKRLIFSTEAAAKAWLDKQAKIGQASA
ncbi:MAG: major tail protein [Marvinbryantia sp.]|uniref:major tail protein n=1 Tax=Marvinbryantia sp. TaxID=2496532 RepID=UPI0025EAA0AF|nr:major tail protein [uncultured Marvinbryantia sp.]